MIIKNQIYLQSNAEIIDDDDAMLIRENQIKELYEMLNPGTSVVPVGDIQAKFLGSPIKYISGWKGAGKTTTMKWFVKKIKFISIDSAYINCRVHDTPVKVVDAVKEVCMEKFPQIPMNSNERKYIQDCVASISPGVQFFLLFDEIDKPLRNSKTPQKDEFLQYLTRLVSESKCQGLKIIFTTNMSNIEQSFSDEVKSFIGMFNHIKFGIYSVPELQQILEKRAAKALYPSTWSVYDLAMISQITFNSFDGDARKAIEILFYLSKEAESKIDIHKLDVVKEHINSNNLKVEVAGYPYAAQCFLKSLGENLKRNKMDEFSEFTTEQAFKFYYDYCTEQGVTKTVGQVQLYRYLNQFEEAMIALRTQNGYRLVYSPLVVLECLSSLSV